MGEKLAKPPLIEAICEFRVREALWTAADADRVFEKLGAEFSVRDLATDQNLDASTGTVTSRSRWLMKRPDDVAMIQMSPALHPLSGALVVNHLRPYDHWQSFREMIARALVGFRAALGDLNVERIGLRYINDLPVAPGVRIRDVLEARPNLPETLMRNRGVFNLYQRCEIPDVEGDGILIHQVGLGVAKPDQTRGLFLDLDFGSTKPFELRDLDAILGWLDRAHERVGEAFFASITVPYLDQLKRGT